MERTRDLFTSRFGLLTATIGMAVGAGNIWRFPRLAGQYGGAFLLPWLLFLFIWSIPLLVVEFGIGRKTRMGTVGSFWKVRSTLSWMGWFVGFCTTAILFYYAVVCGWSLKYFILSLDGQIFKIDHARFWQQFTHGNRSALLYLLLSVAFGVGVIYRGVVQGIEKFSKIVIPSLFVLLAVAALRAVSLPGAGEGVRYFFTIDADRLLDHRLWLDALSQSAWSTGAGWGLLLTYAIYAQNQTKVVSNSFLTGIGNNIASVFAGLAIIPTVFALTPDFASAMETLKAGNQGLAFISLPRLFAHMPAGRIFVTIFFLALFFAAMSSLISMFELATRMLIDFGLPRKKAVLLVGLATFLLGAPSALSLNFFNNQDWVWGLGLLLSGLFFILLVNHIGPGSFLRDWLSSPDKGWRVVGFKWLFRVLMPLQFVLMIGWWFFQSVQWNPTTWWQPFRMYSLGTVLLQWAIVLLAGWMGMRWMNRRLQMQESKERISDENI
jgi:NSS family neurotransmitter:Na+ symporter